MTNKGKIKGSEHCSDPGSQKIVWTQSGNWNLTQLLSLDMFLFLETYCVMRLQVPVDGSFIVRYTGNRCPESCLIHWESQE